METTTSTTSKSALQKQWVKNCENREIIFYLDGQEIKDFDLKSASDGIFFNAQYFVYCWILNHKEELESGKIFHASDIAKEYRCEIEKIVAQKNENDDSTYKVERNGHTIGEKKHNAGNEWLKSFSKHGGVFPKIAISKQDFLGGLRKAYKLEKMLFCVTDSKDMNFTFSLTSYIEGLAK